MNRFDQVEQAVYEILNADSEIKSLVVMIHKRLKDVGGYGDRLPAIGIKCVDVSYSAESGEEIGSGICEVVATGEYDVATEACEKIAGAIYDKLKHYGAAGSELEQDINGIEVSGVKSLGGDVDGRFIALAHVFFAVDL
ncbi:MAG: hypothetical protein WCQ59_08715 [Candidatus Cloacimonadaceae bacterium]|jgi:hypothetical protein|nr:hypothetical protein [Candidatus Cloacimonadota bacterium]MDD2283504.1 hypothetical protein [Eubacteriales bacterium]